ncbi:predicted protein [Postia placenta Mad-698-R]|nr:predicted protein [Postia placenta Mad-698-R]
MEKQDVENELRSTRVQQLSTDFTIQQLTLQPVADIHAENQQLKSESDSLREETANAREDARRSRQDIHKMQTMDDKLCEQRANVADLIMAESEVVLKECMVDLSSELAKYKAMTATTARATESQAESASDVFLTHLQRGVPRFDCFKDLFRPFEAHTIIGLRRLADRFMWHLCPETGYFIAPEHTLPVNVQVPYKDDPLPHAPRKRTIELFCQPLSFGAVWYTGRYEVGNAETMQPDEYKLLPEEVGRTAIHGIVVDMVDCPQIQQYVVEKTSSSLEHWALQDKYLGGQMTALRYPVRRVGYMAGFDHLKTSQTL